jgi:hypothetical protein
MIGGAAIHGGGVERSTNAGGEGRGRGADRTRVDGGVHPRSVRGVRLGVAPWRRHRRRHPEIPSEVPDADARDPGRSPEELAVAAQARAMVARALDRLDPEKRAVFVMFELEELSCVEIAAMIGAPVGTVYSRLHAARAAFARAVEALRDDAAGGP